MFKKLAAKIAYRLMRRRSPRAELVGGTPLATILGVLLSVVLEPAAAAAVAAPLGSLVTVIVNLALAEGPEEQQQEEAGELAA